MTITNPAHWIEQGKFKGDKYNKIVEMIADINTNSTAPPIHDNTKHSPNYMPEAASGDRILLHRFSLGNNLDTFDITNTGGYTLSGSVWTIGKNASWVADMKAPDIVGWTVKYTFSCRVGYTSSVNTVYVMLYNRKDGSPVTGSDVSAQTRKVVGGFGCSQELESGYMTEGANNLDVVADDGYQFYVYNSVSTTVRVDYMNINVYLVKD